MIQDCSTCEHKGKLMSRQPCCSCHARAIMSNWEQKKSMNKGGKRA